MLLPLLASLGAGVAAAGTPLLANPGLENSRDGTWPDGWPRGPALWLEEEGNHFFRLTAAGADKLVMLYREIALPACHPRLELSFRARVTGLKVGAEPWHDARIMMNFKDAAGRKSSPGKVPFFNRDTEGWVRRVMTIDIPATARSLEFMLAMFNAAAGDFDLDDIQITLLGEGAPFPADAPRASAARPATTVRENATPSATPIPDTLLRNGSLEESKDGQWPDHWPRGAGVTYEQEDGNRFLRIASGGPDKLSMIYHQVAVPPGCATLVLSFKTRYTDVRPGKEPWHDARIMMNWKDDTGRKIGSPSPPAFKGSSGGWREVTHVMPVPAEARLLEFMPCMFQTASGFFDIDDLALVPGEPRPPDEKALREDDTPRVEGPRLLTRDGRELWLQGLAIPSLEWNHRGERVLESIKVATEEWHANVIRLPLKAAFWFGEGTRPAPQEDGGKAYRELVDEAVALASSRGCYVVLDLHEYRAPTPRHAAFWRDAAGRYANHPAVLFDLLNEPHGISWKEWRDGGELAGEKREGVVDENREAADLRSSIGMQALVDAVRATGARNVIVAGGLDWAYDLSGILQGYALAEKGGNGIVYSAHIYPWKSDWEGKVLAVARHHPVFLGEVGCQDKPMPFEKVAQDPYKWAPDIIACIQHHKLHWTAWSFHPGAAPCVISDWNYTPTPWWGAFVKAALRGAKFNTGRTR